MPSAGLAVLSRPGLSAVGTPSTTPAESMASTPPDVAETAVAVSADRIRDAIRVATDMIDFTMPGLPAPVGDVGFATIRKVFTRLYLPGGRITEHRIS